LLALLFLVLLAVAKAESARAGTMAVAAPGAVEAGVDATGYSIPLLEGWQPIVLVYNLVNED